MDVYVNLQALTRYNYYNCIYGKFDCVIHYLQQQEHLSINNISIAFLSYICPPFHK